MPRTGRPTAVIELSDTERETLERWARRHKSSQALALRSRIVLACADGLTTKAVAEAQRVNPATVSKWRRRFAADRLEGLADAPRPGAVRTVADETVEAVLVDTLNSAPADATHWSTRGLAAKHGISKTTVAEIWRAFGLKPWRQDGFKVSPDPELVEKVRDLVGLYMNPPDAAAVFALDEKPQIQALNRTAPILPMLPTTPQRATHDYERHGTVDLFAALDMARGTVITDIRARHTSDDFIAFLNKIDRQVPRRPGRGQPGGACHFGQSSDAQDPEGSRVAVTSPPVPFPFHAHLRVVDEHGGAVVFGADDQEAATIGSSQHQGTGGRHPELGRGLERKSQAFCVAQDRRGNP